jgi:hypothetical protein
MPEGKPFKITTGEPTLQPFRENRYSQQMSHQNERSFAFDEQITARNDPVRLAPPGSRTSTVPLGGHYMRKDESAEMVEPEPAKPIWQQEIDEKQLRKLLWAHNRAPFAQFPTGVPPTSGTLAGDMYQRWHGALPQRTAITASKPTLQPRGSWKSFRSMQMR